MDYNNEQPPDDHHLLIDAPFSQPTDQLKETANKRKRGDTVGQKKKLKFADMERMKERERGWRWGWTSAAFSHTPKQFKQPPPPSKLESERTHFTTPDPQSSSSSTNEYLSDEEDTDFEALFKKRAEDIGHCIDSLSRRLKYKSKLTSMEQDSVCKLLSYLNKHDTEADLRRLPLIGPKRAESIMSAKRESTHLGITQLRPIITYDMIAKISVRAADEADKNKDSSFAQAWNSM